MHLADREADLAERRVGYWLQLILHVCMHVHNRFINQSLD
jgi:hypothetical protein